jgi:molybdenum cofactor sulfurtransferase
MGQVKFAGIHKVETKPWQTATIQKEYPQLAYTTYLDHAGTTLYPQSAIQSFARDMTDNLYGNPHSASASSSLSTAVVDEVRKEVLRRFSAPADQFDIVFVPNATAAIKLVAQAFQDQERGFWYGYHRDAHTSLVGVRELAQNGHRCFRSDEEVDLWVENGVLQSGSLGLFGYPAQSNMTGYRPPLTWGGRIREASDLRNVRTYTLLDAASYLTTGNLILNDQALAPDFIALSFYKMFGFPDLGALIVRREAAPILLSRKYFGGGTVEMVVAIENSWHQNHQQHVHEALEDGTIPFHNILALKHAMRSHNLLYPSPVQVANDAASLSRYAYTALENLRHESGVKVVTVYKDPGGQYGNSQTQGPIISLNIHDAHGIVVGKTKVEALACACGFQLRTGSLCNPGGIATMLGLYPWEMRRNYSHGMRCGDDLDFLGGKPTGVLRISLGAMTTKIDIEQFLDFIDFFFVCKDPMKTAEVAHNAEETQKSPISVIQPVRGCRPLVVPVDEFESSVAANAAYMSWHEDWVISDPISKTEIYGRESELRKLMVDIHPLEGKMTITYSGEGHLAKNSLSSLSVDLWDTSFDQSHADMKPHDTPSKEATISRSAQGDAEAFFTSVLGIPATLSRRTNREVSDLKQRKHICVVWNCQRECRNAEDLTKHYNLHARKFAKRKRRAISPTHKNVRPSSRESHSTIKTTIPWIPEDWNKTLQHTKHNIQRKVSKWKPDDKNMG